MEQLTHDSPPVGQSATQQQLDALVLDVIQRHAASLLRTARRHSLCAEDAEDAYQRSLEIFLRHAPRLDPDRAPAWLRTVVKHEAMAVRRIRQRDLVSTEFDFDAVEADRTPSPEEQAIGFEHIARSAEALQRLKPQEVRALWLRAQGSSYDEIQAETGWTRTKVNRCLYEGRRAFLLRYAGIESGEECKRWAPLLSALVDGEATTEQLVELRPHLRQCGCCRAVVRELHRSNAPLAAVFPVAIVVAATDHADAAGNVFLRTYESLTNWATERSASSLVRAQIVTESFIAAAGKGTAVVAATAAAASGGAVVLDQGSGLPATGQRAVLIAHQPTSHASRTDGAARIATAARSSRKRTTARSAPAVVSASQSAAVAPAAHSPAPISPPAVPAPQPAASAPTAEMGLE